MIADLVVPTPGIHAVAWVALVAGISWLTLFAIVVNKNLKATQPGNDSKPASQGYTAVCFLCLVVCVFLSLIVDLGVVLSDAG